MDAVDKVFWATKLNVVPRGGSTADPAAARAQLERSFGFIGKDPIDLIQVLRDKTAGNRSEDEDLVLDNLLYDLRMKYVARVSEE